MLNKREFARHQRVAVSLQRALAGLLQRDLKKSQGLITISYVDVSPDLRHAKVYISCLMQAEEDAALMDIIEQKIPLWRHELGRLVKLRYLPKLTFLWDGSVARADKITGLLRQVDQS